jgi:Ca2+-binding EF-hand superfamily protein
MISGISSTNSYSNLWQVQQSASGSTSTENIFSKMDTDGDGSVSKDELSAFQEEMEAQFANSVTTSQYDTAETRPSTEEIFSKMDTDGDGSVTESELEDFQSQMAKMGPPPSPPKNASSGSDSETDDNSISSILQEAISQYQSSGTETATSSLFATA